MTLELSDIGVSYDGGGTFAVDGVGCAVAEGELVDLITAYTTDWRIDAFDLVVLR